MAGVKHLSPPLGFYSGPTWDPLRLQDCCGMGRTAHPEACLPSSEMNLCPTQQECWWWQSFWANVFIKPRRHRAAQGRLSHLLHPHCIFMRNHSPLPVLGLYGHHQLSHSKLTIWRSGGGSVVPCWLGFQGVLNDWRSGRFWPAVHSPVL